MNKNTKKSENLDLNSADNWQPHYFELIHITPSTLTSTIELDTRKGMSWHRKASRLDSEDSDKSGEDESIEGRQQACHERSEGNEDPVDSETELSDDVGKSDPTDININLKWEIR